MYDIAQLETDLRHIARVFGGREQYGFFSRTVAKISMIKIVDMYITGPVITVDGVVIPLDEVSTDDVIGQTIMEYAVQADEIATPYPYTIR